MPTIADQPRITVIVVNERNGCVTVSVCIQREKDYMPVVLADKVEFGCKAEAYEFALDKSGMCDAKINELPI